MKRMLTENREKTLRKIRRKGPRLPRGCVPEPNFVLEADDINYGIELNLKRGNFKLIDDSAEFPLVAPEPESKCMTTMHHWSRKVVKNIKNAQREGEPWLSLAIHSYNGYLDAYFRLCMLCWNELHPEDPVVECDTFTMKR